MAASALVTGGRIHDQAITEIIKTIRQLMNPPEPKKRPIGFVELEEKKR